MKPLLLENQIMNYAWGSTQAIARLQNRLYPTEKPEAELWMGAHPKAPSTVNGTSLIHLIEQMPKKILGEAAFARYGDRLPILFKLLAANQPLSIQVHPNKQQARSGFIKENEAGTPLSAPHRNYKDNNHKPEILCALTPFQLIAGFRPVNEIYALLAELDLPCSLPEYHHFMADKSEHSFQPFLHAILHLNTNLQAPLISHLTNLAEKRKSDRLEYQWIADASLTHPNDLGLLFILFLNPVTLSPGEAVFVNAGEPHAYFKGLGVELMANSDNVLRAGLTAKHIDKEELIKTLVFKHTRKSIIRSNNQGEYQTESNDFLLRQLLIQPETPYHIKENSSLSILINCHGTASLHASGEKFELIAGASILIPASISSYKIEGNATLYQANIL